MRLLATLVAWLFLSCSFSFAECDVLVLIQPGVAGPYVNPSFYIHPLWILWPKETLPASHSALISLETGADWQSEDSLGGFRVRERDVMYGVSAHSLEQRGVFGLRKGILGDKQTVVIPHDAGSVHETSLILGMTDAGGEIHLLSAGERLPRDGLAILDASSWSEARQAVLRSRGRALVVEYPPVANRPWTRFWLFGRGWPSGVPVDPQLHAPGLVPAKRALRMLVDPSTESWVKDESAVWGGPSHWLEAIDRFASPVGLAYGGFIAALVVLSILWVHRELRAPFLASAIQFAWLAPAALIAAGSACHLVGIDGYPVWSIVSIALLYVSAKLLEPLEKKFMPDLHPLFATGLLGLICVTVFDPCWSLFSPTFSTHPDRPAPEVFGPWIAYLGLVCGTSRGGGLILEWGVRLAVLALTAIGLSGRGWWAPSALPFAILPLVVLVQAEGCWRWYLVPLLPFIGALSYPGLAHGIAWTPDGRIGSASDIGKLDASLYIRSLGSPLTTATVAIACLAALFGNRFFVHQMRRLIVQDPRRSSVLVCSGGLALVGLTQPVLLPAALIVAVAGIMVLLSDALRVL